MIGVMVCLAITYLRLAVGGETTPMLRAVDGVMAGVFCAIAVIMLVEAAATSLPHFLARILP